METIAMKNLNITMKKSKHNDEKGEKEMQRMCIITEAATPVMVSQRVSESS